uniref:Polysaccharide biosynthesis domain containing 1 n=1 Tax=Otus sunia TaxID=257818 RepID=A0A8C8ABY2_9STRI
MNPHHGCAGGVHLAVAPHPITSRLSPLPPLPCYPPLHPQKEGGTPPEPALASAAHQHAQVYFNLISSVDPKFLNLTKVDEQIYGEFRKTFRDLKIDVLDPEELKSEPAKEKWRPFCLRFEGVVEDFNYGTLLRLDCRKDYTEENTIFATRIQFFAIEIARNREGCNSVVYSSAREVKKKTQKEKAEWGERGGRGGEGPARSGLTRGQRLLLHRGRGETPTSKHEWRSRGMA